MFLLPLLLASFILLSFVSCQKIDSIDPNVTAWNYTDNNPELLKGFYGNPTELQGFLAVPQGEGPFPAVIVIPGWNGVNRHENQRATMIAEEWGYVGFAADVYGVGFHDVVDVEERTKLGRTYRANPSLFMRRIQLAIEEVKGMDNVIKDKIGVIGYCFGGTGALMYALLSDTNDVLGSVSVHGGLWSAEPFVVDKLPQTPNNYTRILVLSGGEDDTGTRVLDLENALNYSKAEWELTRISEMEHAAYVFDDERYNDWGDSRTWESAETFFQEIFSEYDPYVMNEQETYDVIPIDYEDSDGIKNISLKGYLAMPNETWARPLPLVVIVPNWDGVNEYEKERATMLADMGYIAFAADVFGAGYQENLTKQEKVSFGTKYLNNFPLYILRIERAIDVSSTYDEVMEGQVAVMGYGSLGGTAAVLYGISGADGAKVSVGFHPSLNRVTDRATKVATIGAHPYVQIFSGFEDPYRGVDQVVLENVLTSSNASWELTTYGNVTHGFTRWGTMVYDVVGDTRSWDSMMSVLKKLLIVPKQYEVESDPMSENTNDISLGLIGSWVCDTLNFFC